MAISGQPSAVSPVAHPAAIQSVSNRVARKINVARAIATSLMADG